MGGMNRITGKKYGTLIVYFDHSEWDVNTDGLIYTDPNWEEEFRKLLMDKYQFTKEAVDAVSYSEQGMQGLDNVNLDVAGLFIRECDKFYRFSAGLDELQRDEFVVVKR